MQARYYDPVIGRFYSNDPIGFRDIHSFNRYAYANNNPYKYTDPDGEHPVRVAARVGYKAGTYLNMGISLVIQATTGSDSLGELIYDSWNGNDDDECFSGFSGCSGGNKGKKGKEKRSGKKSDRDKWGKYSGKKFKKFQKWWENEKQKDGTLGDLETEEDRDKAYEDYLGDQESDDSSEEREEQVEEDDKEES